MQKLLFTILVLVCMATAALAQDPQFTQFYAAPLYHNPAMAGSTFRDRVIVNYRNQWPAMANSFVTYAASYDHFSKKFNSGFGVMAYTDKAGAGELRSSLIAAMYSYQLNLSHTWAMRTGLQLGYGFKNMDYHKLTFGDQIDLMQLQSGHGHYSQTIDETQGEQYNVSYFDAGSGVMLYSENLWFGISALHMNQPNQSMTEVQSLLPMRLNFNAGVRIPLEKSMYRSRHASSDQDEKSVVPVLLYKHQGKFDQLDLGCYVNYHPMVVGLWYRGLPVKKYQQGVYNYDAVAMLVGFKHQDFSFGYSYDLTISSLGPGSGGAHELSLAYEFDTKSAHKKKKPKLIPCPKF